MARFLALALCLGVASAFAPAHRPVIARSPIFAEGEAAPAAKAEVAVPAPAEPVVAAAEEPAEPPPPPPPKFTVSQKALPFMPVPANLNHYEAAGNYGFDPLGFSNWVNVDFLREAELKHGRICQLAVVGFAATDLGFRVYPDPNGLHQVSSIAAHDMALSYGGMNQIFLWLGIFEIISTVAVNQMVNEGSGRVPGDFALDPMKWCKDEKTTADMKLKEIVHCRLAMFAFSGMVTQAVLTQGPFPYIS